MRLLSLSAAVAVATAAANYSVADAAFQGTRRLFVRQEEDPKMTGLTALTGGDKDCVQAINTWRKKVSSQLKESYTAIDHSSATTDLGTFLPKATCKSLKDGTYQHFNSGAARNDNSLFIISASTSETAKSGTEITCEEAIKIWESGFKKFTDEYPPVYEEAKGEDEQQLYNAKVDSADAGVYTDPNAAALVSLLSDTAQKMVCGTAEGCEESIMVCYFKPSGIKDKEHPVKPEIWHDVQVYFKTKPALDAQEDKQLEFVKAVNEVRQCEELDLPPFTTKSQAKGRSKRAAPKEYESFLYELTCGDVENSEIDPSAAEGYTIIYAVKDGATAPTAPETIKHWESGFEKLNHTIPPVFKKSSIQPENSDNSNIYMDSSVAGYVSIMTDEARTMQCYSGTGCGKATTLCVLEKATLEDNKRPISEETWAKIEKLHNIEKPTFKAIDGNCLEDINAVRTQEGIGLKGYTDGKTEKKSSTTELSTLLQGITCNNLKDSKITVTDTSNTLMYHYDSDGTCSSAVTEWKKGLSKLSDKQSLPKYTSTEELYKDASVTNFVSLMSDSQEAAVQCFELEGCEKKSMVCELKPAVLTESKEPISAENWKKITENMKANGSTASFSMAALLSSAVLAVAGFALQL